MYTVYTQYIDFGFQGLWDIGSGFGTLHLVSVTPIFTTKSQVLASHHQRRNPTAFGAKLHTLPVFFLMGKNQQITPWKIDMQPKHEGFGRCFFFQLGEFLDSMSWFLREYGKCQASIGWFKICLAWKFGQSNQSTLQRIGFFGKIIFKGADW